MNTTKTTNRTILIDPVSSLSATTSKAATKRTQSRRAR